MYKKPFIQAIREQSFAEVLRLDAIHPEVSGNKWYKLKYHLQKALVTGKTGLASFGGPYSNHLVALADACRQQGLSSAGFIRGEEPAVYGPSLQQMRQLGMRLIFLSREAFRRKEAPAGFEQYQLVPEGGGGILGVRGAAEILAECKSCDYTHILCAVGTGTTLAGIVNASSPNQQIIGISSIKVENTVQNELLDYIDAQTRQMNYKILFDYHFGGYARKTEELLSFMNELYARENIPTDFVYTGKLFFAVYDLIRQNYFPPSSRILIIHSGGLQGNRSLPPGTLLF